MIRAQTILGSAIALLGVTAVVLVFRTPAEVAPARSFTSSQQCKECHAQEHAEWSASQHAHSWLNPDVRALSNDFANTDCIDCHAPQEIYSTGIGARVLPRASRRAEGVDCIACHALPDGGVAGTKDNPAAPCRPQAMASLKSVDHCAGCHDQHKTVSQWRETQYAAQGIGCVECHMPARADGSGHDHTMHGGHSLKTVRKAVTLVAERSKGLVRVALTNSGAGHHFPTDERSRAADLWWRPVASEGAPAESWRHLWRFRSPYRHEVDLVDTLLPSAATKEVWVDDPASLGAVEVALTYKRTPYWKDPLRPDPETEAEFVHRVVLQP